jgi:hypothetical protein
MKACRGCYLLYRGIYASSMAGNFALTTRSGVSPSTATIGMYKIEKIHIEDWISATDGISLSTTFRVVLVKSISGS